MTRPLPESTYREVVEALTALIPYAKAEYEQRKAMYEPYGMERKWTSELGDFKNGEAALATLQGLPTAPFAKGSWQHAVDDQLVGYGKTSEEFATPHEAVAWLVQQTGDAAVSLQGLSPAQATAQTHVDAILQEIEYAKRHGWPSESCERLERFADAAKRSPAPAQATLTDEQIDAIADDMHQQPWGAGSNRGAMRAFARAIWRDCFPASSEPSDDEVFAIAERCGWSQNRRQYMTEADQRLWCEQMRAFWRIARAAIQAALPKTPARPGATKEQALQAITDLMAYTGWVKQSQDIAKVLRQFIEQALPADPDATLPGPLAALPTCTCRLGVQTIPRDCARHGTPPLAPTVQEPQSINVSVHQCDNCTHIGINDEHETDGLCSRCEWRGDYPNDGCCPECQSNDVGAVCPSCDHGPYRCIVEGSVRAPTGEAGVTTNEILVLLVEHDGDDSPSVALARNRAELLEQVKVAVWGEPHPADTTNDAGDDMAEGITDTLLETGRMTFEGDPPLRLVHIPVEGWLATPPAAAGAAIQRVGLFSRGIDGELCLHRGATDAQSLADMLTENVTGGPYVALGAYAGPIEASASADAAAGEKQHG